MKYQVLLRARRAHGDRNVYEVLARGVDASARQTTALTNIDEPWRDMLGSRAVSRVKSDEDFAAG